MKRRIAIVGLAIVLLAAGTVASRPLWMKWRTQRALEEAASNACACMLGRHGDAKAGLLAVRAGIIAKPDPPDRSWPARCKPWGEAALAAYAEAARWSTMRDLGEKPSWTSAWELGELEAYWVRDPDPRVPLPDPRAFALDENQLVPIVSGVDPELRIVDDRLEINGASRIDRDDHVDQSERARLAFPGHPQWRAIDSEPGAKRFWTDDAFFYDDQGRALGSEWAASVVWARSFADGRLVAHVYVVETDANYGEIWEYAPGKKLARVRFERDVPFASKATTSIDEWMLYKHVGADRQGSVAAIDFSRGVAAKPITLGPVEKTSRVLGRSYGTCRAHGTFVDMDPSFLIRTKDGWKFVGLQQSVNRVVSCEGDVAMVTEWIPLEIRRCTVDGCTLVPFPRLDTRPDDAFAADEHHVFQIVRDDGAVGVHVYALDNPADARHVPLLAHAIETGIRVVAGRAIVFVRTKPGAGWAAITVRPDGTVHAITP